MIPANDNRPESAAETARRLMDERRRLMAEQDRLRVLKQELQQVLESKSP